MAEDGCNADTLTNAAAKVDLAWAQAETIFDKSTETMSPASERPALFVLLGAAGDLAQRLVVPADMRFSYRDAFRTRVPAAYETLVYEVPARDQSLFMRADQIEAAWTLLQPVLDAWTGYPAVDLPSYPASSRGPESAEGLISRGGTSWLAPSLPEPQP